MADIKADDEAASYETAACEDDHVHVRITMKSGRVVPLVFEEADEAYNFAQAILRAYDDAVGITPPGEL